MTSTSQVAASLPARAPEAATDGPRSARGSARRSSGSADRSGVGAPTATGPSGEAFTTELARQRRHAAEMRVRESREKSADDAARDGEREAARPDDAAVGVLAAPIDPALPAASEQGIGVLSVRQGEALLALGVQGAAGPGPDSLELGLPVATVEIEGSAAAQGPGSPPAIGLRRAVSAPGLSAGSSDVATVRWAIGPSALARAAAAGAEVAPEAPSASPAPVRENARGASTALRAVSAARPTTPSVAGEVAVPAVPVAPALGAAVSAAQPGLPGAALRAADGGAPSPDEAGQGDLSSQPEQEAGRARVGADPSLRVAAGPELAVAVSAPPPRRPGATVRAADGERPSPDEAGQRDLSSGIEPRPRRASAVDPVLRVAAAPVDRAPLRDEAGLGEGGPETGDGQAIALLGPGQPAAAGEQKTTQAQPGVSARSAAEQIAEEVAERLGLFRRPGLHEISLELRPDNLGTVHLAARLEGLQLTLEIRAELAQSREILQQALPQLRELLAQQGIDAGRLTIHLGLDTAARDFSEQRFGAPPHFKRDEAVPGAAAPDGAPIHRRQPGPGGFDFLV